MNVEKNLRCQRKESRGALPVIPTQTNFIAKARKGINVFKKEPPEKESRREILLQFLL